MNIKDLVRCGDIELIDLLVDLDELHTDPEWFEAETPKDIYITTHMRIYYDKVDTG